MPALDDLRRRSRRGLHDHMARAAVYNDPARGWAVACSVRVHHRTDRFGDMTGFDYQPTERVTTVPEIVFLSEQVAPERGAAVVLSPDEVYSIEAVFPPDGITTTVQATRMGAAEIADDPLIFEVT